MLYVSARLAELLSSANDAVLCSVCKRWDLQQNKPNENKKHEKFDTIGANHAHIYVRPYQKNCILFGYKANNIRMTSGHL